MTGYGGGDIHSAPQNSCLRDRGVRSWRQHLRARSHAGLVCSQDDNHLVTTGLSPSVPARRPEERTLPPVPGASIVRESGESICDFKGLLDSRFLAPVPSWHSNDHGQRARQSPWSFEKGRWGLRLRVRVQTPQVLSDKQGPWGHGLLCRACGCPETLLGTDASGLHLPACTQVCGPCCPKRWCR